MRNQSKVIQNGRSLKNNVSFLGIRTPGNHLVKFKDIPRCSDGKLNPDIFIPKNNEKEYDLIAYKVNV